MIDSLPASALRTRCDADQFEFETTDDLPGDTAVVGQDRAVEALNFGINIDSDGFNVFVQGPPGTGRRDLVRLLVQERSTQRPVPPDWCYVNNFEEARKPRVIRLASGRGPTLRADMEQFVEDAKTALPATFESEEYQTRRQLIQEEVREDQEEALEDLQQRAREDDIALVRTPNGFAFAPIRDGDIVSPEDIETMPEEERDKAQEKIETFQKELQQILRKVPERQREARRRMEELNREMAGYAIGDLIDELKEKYNDNEAILHYLGNVREDMVENVGAFVNPGQQGGNNGGKNPLAALTQQGGQNQQNENAFGGGAPWRRYRVNVVVDNSEAGGAPVIFEDNPNHQNLVGQVEQIAQMGALVTDFNLIQPGALHKANGGFLIIEARKMLQQPYAWEGLKRAMKAGEICIESPRQALGLMSTVTLEPEPIPLRAKIVLVGERHIYQLLCALDPEMSELFKVMADFGEQVDRNEDTPQRYADMIATLIKNDDLRPFDRSAVARVIDRSTRLVSDTEKLSAHLQSISDLLHEANYWAREAEVETVSAEHVQCAIDAQTHRSDRLRERVQESILRETMYISTEGEAVGQINGLAVVMQSTFSFGRPNRITARVSLGKGDIVDIERESSLSGPLHSKGVLILTGFLNGRYARQHPLSLSASLVFEQSYAGVDGDSASSAELYALLSAIAEVPIRQGLAVTGSVNQHGQVQPIGGVNEKIEGFFDICDERGLTGNQGVLIPASNVKNLMLRDDVVEAVADGQFRIYPVETIDQGIELLTGIEAGTPDEKGNYPDGSLNARVQDRLADMAQRRRQFAMTNGQAEATHEQ